MKKSIILAAVAAATMSAWALRTADEIRSGYAALESTESMTLSQQRRNYVRNILEPEWRALFEDVISFAATNTATMSDVGNLGACRRFGLAGVNVIVALRANNSAFDTTQLRSDYDGRFAEMQILCPPDGIICSWPQVAAAYCERNNYAETRPALMRLINEARDAGRDSIDLKNLSFGAYLEFMAERWEFTIPRAYAHAGINGRVVAKDKAGLQKAGLRQVKHALRKGGKTFVAKDGFNPVEKPMADLSVALDAPRFAGLEEWCNVWCPEAAPFAVRLSAAIPDAAEIDKLKDAIMLGDSPFKAYDEALLRIALGVEAYNAFVKEYNGD